MRRAAAWGFVLVALAGVAGCGDDDGCPPGLTGVDGACACPDGTAASSADECAMDGGRADPCTADRDCDDGRFCTGVELCDPASPAADGRGCTPGAAPCLPGQTCDEARDACESDCGSDPDADGDGHDAFACGGDDCDDADADRYPGNPEVCDADGRDEDCDPTSLGADEDGDGFVGEACCNLQPGGELACGVDCDDQNREVNPDAIEVCNGLDDNCNDVFDGPGEDDDGDGWPDPCTGEPTPETDCDDNCPTCFPGGGPEVCDGADQDCDGVVDDGVTTRFFRDRDGDGHGDPTEFVDACSVPGGYVTLDDDCNDDCRDCRPGGREECDGALDENCSGDVDEGCSCRDGATRPCPGGTDVGACVAGTQTCVDGAWEPCVGRVPPRAETCNGLDDDCDDDRDEFPAESSCELTANVTVAGCRAGGCFAAECTPGFGDCDGDWETGCEARLDTLDDCGACGVSCGWHCGESGCDDVVQVAAAARHACGLLESGRVVCWGDNQFGQLGRGTRAGSVNLPGYVLNAVVEPLTGVVEVAAGGTQTCVRLTAGRVSCWGAVPTPVPGPGLEETFSDATSLAVGIGGHACAVRTGGRVACWGWNDVGQLGWGRVSEPSEGAGAVREAGGVELTDAEVVACGNRHTCALLGSGEARCWGANDRGQLGDGTTSDSLVPRAVLRPSGSSVLSGITSLDAGHSHTCAVLVTGEVLCWGSNDYGEIGDGRSGTAEGRSRPTYVLMGAGERLLNAEEVGAGNFYSCVRLASRQMRCWGSSAFGTLGAMDGFMTLDPVPTPVPVVGIAGSGRLRDVVGYAPGGLHNCALLSGNIPVCWGRNNNGELGRGAELPRFQPERVNGLE